MFGGLVPPVSFAMTELPIDNDPPPVPPVRPPNEDCCNSGCNPCVFDLYEEALERYRAEYRAWVERRSKK
jgi:hypothetical protein